ncbi:hypothetical protein RRG08_016855 [Elysia crispata]|uniref:Uncharacterized protein n=1 Tax=Elysia crispata TaxID=231223 RepID=A0AAE1CJ21_9GAST|nr:hypothetical protein RRG08_016855 [Elysia crispata]
MRHYLVAFLRPAVGFQHNTTYCSISHMKQYDASKADCITRVYPVYGTPETNDRRHRQLLTTREYEVWPEKVSPRGFSW